MIIVAYLLDKILYFLYHTRRNNVQKLLSEPLLANIIQRNEDMVWAFIVIRIRRENCAKLNDIKKMVVLRPIVFVKIHKYIEFLHEPSLNLSFYLVHVQIWQNVQYNAACQQFYQHKKFKRKKNAICIPNMVWIRMKYPISFESGLWISVMPVRIVIKLHIL